MIALYSHKSGKAPVLHGVKWDNWRDMLIQQGICWFSWSKYFHAGWLDPFDNFDAITEGCFWETLPKGGVQRVKDYAVNHNPGTQVEFYNVYKFSGNTLVKIGRQDYLKISQWWYAHAGCKYDWISIAGFVLREKLGKPNEFFCSESDYLGLMGDGITLSRKKPYQVAPCDLIANPAMTVPAYTKIIV